MSRITRIAMAIAASALVSTGFYALAAPAASADPCNGDWSIGVGGFQIDGNLNTGQTSSYFNADQPVGYNSADPAGGVAEINRLYWEHRKACPADHIKIVGHSEGAALVHAWVSKNKDAKNTSAVLISDPKRAAGPGGPGMSVEIGFLGWPIAGNDSDFGSVPTLSICNNDDHVCNSDSDWSGYLWGGAHGRYDFNAADYADDANGIDYR